MLNTTHEKAVALFATFTENVEIRRAMDLLLSADGDTQHVLLSTSTPITLARFFSALGEDEHEEIARGLVVDVQPMLKRILLQLDADMVTQVRMDRLLRTPGRQAFCIENGRLVDADGRDDPLITAFTRPPLIALRDLSALEGLGGVEALITAFGPLGPPQLVVEKQSIMMIWKQPASHASRVSVSQSLGSIGMLLREGKLTIIADGELPGLHAGGFAFSAIDTMLETMECTMEASRVEAQFAEIACRQLDHDLARRDDRYRSVDLAERAERLAACIDVIAMNNDVLEGFLAAREECFFTSEERQRLARIIRRSTQYQEQLHRQADGIRGFLRARDDIRYGNLSSRLGMMPVVIWSTLGGVLALGFWLALSAMPTTLCPFDYALILLALLALTAIVQLSIRSRLDGSWID